MWAEVHQDQSSTHANSTNGQLTMSRRGKLNVASHGKPMTNVAEQGEYFVATNPTAGTGVAGLAAADGINPLEALCVLTNDNTAASGKRIYLDFLTLFVTAAGTNGTDVAFVHHVDNADRYTSGGSAITEVNPNADSSNTSGATIYFGAIVAPAATSARLLGGGILRVVISVIGDIYNFNFGGHGDVSAAGIVNSTAPAVMNVPCVPVILGQGDSWIFQLNCSSQSVAKSLEFQLGYWEY